MHTFVLPLLSGAALVFAVFGIGRLALKLLRLRSLPWYWRATFAALLGQAAVSLFVEALLLSGASSTPRLRFLGWFLLALGATGHVIARGKRTAAATRLSWSASDKFLATLLGLVWLTNLAIALAPSTKIDELFYHMLTPKRIVADGTLNYYLLPLESAIVPQMHYQISLSPAYALGAPEAGNVLSLAYSVVLGLFIIGLVEDATRSRSLGLLAGLVSAVGIYQAVWHTTEGAASLGELALVVALCGALWPRLLAAHVKPLGYGLLVVFAAAIAAATKISLLPLCVLVTLLAVWQTYRLAGSSRAYLATAAAACFPWIPIHLPLMAWTYRASGSFWGPVVANVFRPSVFPTSILKMFYQFRINNQVSILSNLRLATIELSPLMIAAIGFIVWRTVRRDAAAGIILGLALLQAWLILWQLPYDFRFFSGLLYLPLIAACLALVYTNQRGEPVLTSWGARLAENKAWIAALAVVPWLAAQMYFATPFAEVVAGFSPKSEFQQRYVALSKDYAALDQILPRDAVLYIPVGRPSLFDAPRPVVLTPLDLRQQTSIYRLSERESVQAEPINATSNLNCDRVVYADDEAVIEAYRTPGKQSKLGSLEVRSCRVESVTTAGSVTSGASGSAGPGGTP